MKASSHRMRLVVLVLHVATMTQVSINNKHILKIAFLFKLILIFQLLRDQYDFLRRINVEDEIYQT